MKKNVAFFLPHFRSGGAEGVVLKIIQLMDRIRFHPTLILQKKCGELLQHVPNDVAVLTLKHPRVPRCIPALAKLCHDHKIDLVTTVTNAANLYALASAILPKSNFATLVMEHTPPSAFFAEAKYSQLRLAAMKFLFPKANLCGGPIQEIGDDITMYLGHRAPPFQCLPNPVVDRIQPLREVSEKATHIVSVGRLAPEKRFDLLINAFARLHRHKPETRLTIFGEGPERAHLNALISSLGIAHVVNLPGFINDMDAAHATSDVFVCTSRREGLGNAMIEAMARGVPILSVDCPFGPRKLLQNGAAGCLLESDSPEAIATALDDLLSDKQRRERYSGQAIKNIAQYEIAYAVSCYENAFDAAMINHQR